MKRNNNSIKRYDIAIIGTGICGLSMAYQLHLAGYEKVVLVDSAAALPSSGGAFGVACSGFHDNFTRLSHTFGLGQAAEIWRFGLTGFETFEKFLKKQNLAIEHLPDYRIALTEQEEVEQREAINQLQAAGFSVAAAAKKWTGALSVQQESPSAVLYQPAAVLAALANEVSFDRIESPIMELDVSSSGVCLELSSHTIQAEIVVLAANAACGEIAPQLVDCVTPIADQAVYFELEESVDSAACHFRYRYGLVRGFVNQAGLWFSGGRYLRTHAGIGANQARYELAIEAELLKEIQSLLRIKVKGDPIHRYAGMLSTGCDELPLLGPAPGEDRLYLLTGFMTNAFSWGFYGAQCITELILHGHCAGLPEVLQPRRLRSFSH